jgi:hypothetical protein
MAVPDVSVFLAAYHPLFICVKCLATVMHADPTSLAPAIHTALLAGQVEVAHQPCLNCGIPDTAVRTSRP